MCTVLDRFITLLNNLEFDGFYNVPINPNCESKKLLSPRRLSPRACAVSLGSAFYLRMRQVSRAATLPLHARACALSALAVRALRMRRASLSAALDAS